VNGDLDNHTLWVHFLWSMYRVFSAFLLTVVIKIPVGIAMGVSRFARGLFDPPIEFYRPLPPLAYLPLMIIWFGIGEWAKIMLLFLAIFAPVALAARAGAKSASQEQIQAALAMGASRTQVICHVTWDGRPWSPPRWWRLTPDLESWSTMPRTSCGTDVVIVGIIAIGLVAYVFEMLMRWLERVLVPWKGKV
jgi:taurine transport system permease protein